MYKNPGNNSNNGKMAIEKNQFIKYKPISGRLKEHFGFKLLADGNIKNADNVYCIHCDKSFAYHGSNRSLTYHLQKKHLSQYSKLQPTKSASFGQFTAPASSTSKQTTLSQFCRRSDQPVSAIVQRDITISLTKWIASSGRPISMVEDDGLQQLLRTALQNDEYKIPCRLTIDKMLTHMYNTKMESIKEAVKNSKAVALTSDFWTSLGNESYCGIICHWITDDWNLKGVVLACVHVVERHYSVNVAELYKQFANGWDITKKIQVLVTDNARNMVSAVNQTGFSHIPCLTHSLQLSILHGFKAADTEVLFVKCRKLRDFKHSPVNTTELQNCGDSPLRKLEQDVPTRRNSVFEMLQSLLRAREALTLYISTDGKHYKGPKLFDSDWEKISKYVAVLDIFRQATVLLGGDKYVVCSCVLPLLSSLTKYMTVNDDDPGYIARFNEASANDFNERVANTKKSIAVLKIATVLDPRYKNSKCLTDDAKEQTWSLIEQQIASDDWLKTYVQDDTNSVNSTISESNEKRFKLMEADSDSEEDVESASDEVQRYKIEKKVAASVDTLQW